jgi:hypothetical protein
VAHKISAAAAGANPLPAGLCWVSHAHCPQAAKRMEALYCRTS